jgi:hypothetical protein
MSNAEPWHHFPSFELLFQRANDIPLLYLTLLRLSENVGGNAGLQGIRAAIQRSSDLDREVVALLEEVNWRPNLVGAAAVALGAASSRTLAALWAAADQGSWVSPQLAAVASMADSQFLERARTRIEQGCPLSSNRLGQLSPAELHSSAGPGGARTRSAKFFSALVTLVEKSGSAPDWLATALARKDLQALLADDVDDGGRIALAWHERINRATAT